MPLPPGLPRALERAEAHPHDPDATAGVRHVQTHISHVFLTATRVYKLRKAVTFDFVDFGTRTARDDDCVREVRLNRRLAADVYLGVAPIHRDGDGFRVGTPGDALDASAVEHCVVMRRLPDGRDARSLLEAGRLGAAQLDALAERIASFHLAQRLAPDTLDEAAWRARVRDAVAANFATLRAHDLDAEERRLVDESAARAERVVRAHWDRFDARRRAGRVVDAHGDLHLEHVWFERDDAPPLAIDCLEFRDDLRRIDAAAEVAFLAMDLAYRGRRDLADRFVRVYAGLTDDFELYGVLDYYVSYRAAVRAAVASLALRDAEMDAEQRAGARRSRHAHLALAASALAPPPRGAVVALSGVVGTGKSSVAAAIADATGGVVIASDRVRKHQHRGQPAASLYGQERTTAVYRGLLARAEPVLASGRVAVLDATYPRRDWRAELRAWAADRRVVLVAVECAPAVARARLAERARRGTDPSDAGPAFYDASVAGYEPPDEWPPADLVRVRTDGDWRDAVADVARRLTADG